MKFFLLVLLLIISSLKIFAQDIPIVKAKKAGNFIGKEIFVVGQIEKIVNMGFILQYSVDLKITKKRFLNIAFGNNLYYASKTRGDYLIGKKAIIKGIVTPYQNEPGFYLLATDTIRLCGNSK